MNGQSIGIDLGTYNSCAAYAVDGQVQMIKRHVQLQIMSGERSYPDPSSSPQPPSPPRNGEEKGEKE